MYFIIFWFRKEMKKVLESKRSGASQDEIYNPTLWYYDLLLFTKDQELPTDSLSNLGENECPDLDVDVSTDAQFINTESSTASCEEQQHNEVMIKYYVLI